MNEEDTDNFSATSETETASSSGLTNSDIAIFCDRKVTRQVTEAERILLEQWNFTISVSCRDCPAGRSKLANLYSFAKRSKFRVFLITEELLQNDFDFHMRLLENANLCSKRNCLLLLHKPSYVRKIPPHLGDLTYQIMDNIITAESIVKMIIEFQNELGLTCLEDSDHDTNTSDGSNYSPVDIHSMKNTRKEMIREYENEQMQFRKRFGTITKKRCYILISSPIRDCSQSLRNVTCVPWVKVFDFDSTSSTEGLYTWALEALSKRNLVRTTRPDEIEPPNDDTINWVSITGKLDQLGKQDDQDVNEITVPQRAILHHGESLADYCIGRKIPVILVMWYRISSHLNKALDDFLTGMRHHLKGRLDSFECIVCVHKVPSKKSSLYGTLDRLGIIENTIAVPVDILCDWMKDCAESSSNIANDFLKTLPKYPEEGENEASVEIAEQELLWIRSHVYILVKSQTSPMEYDVMSEAMKQLVTSFLKGFRIHWNLLECGYFDVSRDLLEEVKQYIEEKHISTGRSGVITIFHAPGGGGTTFARRLLHDFHNKVPCGEIVSERFALKNIDERLTVLRDITYLPIILLLDGNSMHDVKKMLAMKAKTLILIHVRRYINESGKKVNTGSGKYFLEDTVSAEESINFAKIYSHAAPKKSGALQKLSKDSQKGKPHFIFEYGMTAFQSQFVGVRKYVHGYLQLNQDREILNWHVALVYLSLANYYGHRGLPCKLFSKLLKKREDELVELSDLPPAAQQFISEEDDTWKITHYVVSKLIIEQVLVRRESPEYSCSDNSLSAEACQNLSTWALRFIRYITEYVGVSSKLVSHIYEIVTSIFIRRNYDDPGETETGSKTHYSKIIDEIKNAHEQEKVFVKLVKTFPRQAEFRAHLGRFYSKQNRFDEADDCFKRAIVVRQQMGQSDKLYATCPDIRKPDEVMQRIYNMSGFACLSNLRANIGVYVGKLNDKVLQGKKIPELIRFCLNKGHKGIESFENGRLYYQKSSNPSFANIGELKLRLQLTELAKIVSGNDFTWLLSRPSPFQDLAEFALQSFHECDKLLAECIADRSRDIEIPEQEITFCFNHYNIFFKNATEALRKWAGNDGSMHSMKCHLSVLKTKLKPDSKSTVGRKHFRLNEDVKNTKDILELVRLYEKICDSACMYGLRTRISGYMMEWLRAIRHRCMTKVYSQVDVLNMVEKWKKKKEVGSLCDFYCYLLCTTICISSLSRDVANVYASKSYKLKEAIKHNNDMPIYATGNSEWLGERCNQDFNRLIHFTELGEWNGKFWKDPEKISRLQVCSGSIQHCRPHDGIIMLDGNRDARITVFFVPNKYGISPYHSKRGTRVEFYLAFNTRHLAEGYEVTLLKSYPCPNCNLPTEVPTLGKMPSDKHGICNSCESKVAPI